MGTKTVFVDGTESDDSPGSFMFAYMNKNGDQEGVSYGASGAVAIVDSEGDSLSIIYLEDIPKLIKALQAALTQSEKDTKND